MSHVVHCSLAACVLIAGVAASTAQTGGGSSSGSSSAGSAPSGSSSGASGSTTATPRSSTPAARPGAIRAPSASQGLHPIQRDQPAAAAPSQQSQPLGSGGKSSGDSAAGGPAAGESKAGGSLLALTAEEKEKVRNIIRSYSLVPSDAGKFPLRLGASVPANVPLKPLPPEVAKIVPDYKNYSYVMTQNQIAIVITEKREIDLLIPG